MARKRLMNIIQENIPDLEETLPIFLSTKANKIPKGTAIDVLIYPPGFMLQIDFSFFNVESIRGFNSTFLAICSTNSHPFGFKSRSKHPPLDILKLLVTTLMN